MNNNAKAKSKLLLSRTVAYLVLIFLSVLCLFFFYLMILNSSHSNFELQGSFTFKFGKFFADNFNNAWNDASIKIPRGMLNSFLIAIISAVLNVYFSALTAYGIYAYDFKLKKIADAFIIAVMMIPSQVSTVGFIQLAYKYNLTNKLWLLIVPSIAGPATYFYMKQYLKATLPLEIVEAARIDGSNEFVTFNRIVLPVMKPAIAVQMIFSFIASWNNYFTPSLLLTKAEYKTVPIMIAQLRSADYSKFDLGKMYMFIMLAILPVMIVYIILSKSIIKGVTSGSVKG
ncbi:MAG: carbohydrate ABC transporter permease [Erysipelotrichaceae bacterium]|nr:carbohydrate ABC transporter permease [Erysipelotrichaceae bacterium]